MLKGIYKKCPVCKNKFYISKIHSIKRIYCSIKCRHSIPISKNIRKKISNSLKGITPWNKGITGYSTSLKGRKRTWNSFSEFKKGRIPWNKGKPFLKGNKNPNWGNGQTKYSGYVFIFMPEHPNSRRHYVKRANLIMEKRIGRFLKPEEIVHHINGVKDDDSPKNLMLFKNKSAHRKYHCPKGTKIGRNAICKNL